MRFVVTAGLASSGETLPFVSVAAALRRRSHDVCLVGNPVLAGHAERAGLRFVPVGSSADYTALQADTSLFGSERADGLQILRRYSLPLVRDYYHVVEGEIAASPVIVVTNETGSVIAAEKHARPLVAAVLSPARLRSRYDPPHPERFLPAWTRWVTSSPRRLAWAYRLKGLWTGRAAPASGRPVVPPGSPVARLRTSVGLPPFEHSTYRAALLMCLWPDWFGAPQPDWPNEAVTCGFALSDPSTSDSSDLAGLPFDPDRPTVVATTGSLATSQERFFATVVAACRELGWGAVLVTPHREQVPGVLPPHVVHVPSAPFDVLFPRAAVVIHHGGIGTVAQALAAGVPQLVSPLRGEQFDIGNRAARLGVARMMPVGRVASAALARALQQMVRSDQLRRSCGRWQARLAEESKSPAVVDRLEGLAAESG